MDKRTATKNEIGKIIKRMESAAEKKIRTTKEITYNPKTETYVQKIRSAPRSEKEIVTKWGNEILDRGFTLIPNVMIDNLEKIKLRDKHIIIIITLIRYGQGKKHAYPGQETLAKKTGYNKKTIMRAVKELKNMGYLKVCKRYLKPENRNPRRTSNLYDFTGLLKKLEEVIREEKEEIYT